MKLVSNTLLAAIAVMLLSTPAFSTTNPTETSRDSPGLVDRDHDNGHDRDDNLAPGQVTATQNPQVAQYALTLPLPGKWHVNFGTTTAYGRSTSVRTVHKPGTQTTIYVAGMLPKTAYHMQATAELADGITLTDVDHVFTTGPLPSGFPAAQPVTLGFGSPQPGIELINPWMGPIPSSVYATDLQGNVIWTYVAANVLPRTFVYPVKLVPNGDLLLFVSPPSYPVGQSGSDALREVDLAGNTVRELTIDQLNAGLVRASLPGTMGTYTHDLEALPNGHVLVIVNSARQFTGLPGYSGTTTVVGDAVVDLDRDWNPVWVWNEFDHFDVNRHPMGFPDWTHSNSVTYSPEDGNFIVSMRHQNWIVKVDYRNGRGDGDVLWKLGQGGDFALHGAVDPTDWFYAQHDAQFVGKKSAGEFTLSVMDNGDDRLFPAGVTCGTASAPPCLYSTIQLLHIDEKAKTAAFQFHQILPTYLYSSWGGNVETLGNGDIEYDLSGTAGGSQAFEVTNQSNPQLVWNLYQANGSASYRAFRLPSLYPGVQW